jgi:acyl-ACP thioesterase
VSDQFNELLSQTPGVRAFSQPRRPGFADCAPSGRIRLDALACWLQDVAYADVEDAGLERAAVWVVRRTRIRVNRFPRFGEAFQLTTFCSGLGRMWAERRTDVVRTGVPPSVGGPDGGRDGDPDGGRDGARPDVEAVSLWVHLDVEHWRPAPLSAEELTVYGGVPPERRVSARLRHPAASDQADGAVGWTFRATESDIAGHVNNAAYWAPLEEELLAGRDPIRIDAELEYRTPAQPGHKRFLRHGRRRWLVGEDGELHATIAIAAAMDGDGG